MARRILLLPFIIGMTLAGTAMAHDDDVPFAEWMMSLRQPDAPHVSCCGPSDQFYVDSYEPSAKYRGGFSAMLNGKTIEIPATKVIWDRPNPTGRGILFMAPMTETIFCFVPGMGV